MLAVVEVCMWKCLALVVDTSLAGLHIAHELDAVIRWRGWPARIVSDNGIEPTSMTDLRWCQLTGVEWHLTTAPTIAAVVGIMLPLAIP